MGNAQPEACGDGERHDVVTGGDNSRHLTGTRTMDLKELRAQLEAGMEQTRANIEQRQAELDRHEPVTKDMTEPVRYSQPVETIEEQAEGEEDWIEAVAGALAVTRDELRDEFAAGQSNLRERIIKLEGQVETLVALLEGRRRAHPAKLAEGSKGEPPGKHPGKFPESPEPRAATSGKVCHRLASPNSDWPSHDGISSSSASRHVV